MREKTLTQINGFVDALQTMTPRGSFYNSKDEKIQALKKRHKEIRTLDEELYTLFMFYPGINDYNRLSILGSILQEKSLNEITLPVVVNGTNKLQLHRSFAGLLRDVSYPRGLKLFIELKKRKVNNKRVKKSALEFILSDPKLVRRAVTYRTKMREALKHIWGVRTSGSIGYQLSLGHVSTFLEREALWYRNSEIPILTFKETILFILGIEYEFKVPLLKAYKDSKEDIQKGLDGHLPYETLMGFRNKLFTGFKLKIITETAAKTMTPKQKVVVATKAAKMRNATIEVDYSKVDPAQVYREAYRGDGLTPKMIEGINKKIDQYIHKFGIKLGKIALIIDNSQSMQGVDEQANEAISRVLSLGKFFERSSEECKRFYTNDVDGDEDLPSTGGDSGFARLLIQAAKTNPDTILILSDGYENSPEGLTDLVMEGLKHAGSDVKVVHINPTYAAETATARTISPKIPTLPVSDVSKLEGTFMKSLWERNADVGIDSYKKFLLSYAAPYLANQLPGWVVEQLKGYRQPEINFGALV